MIRGFWFLTGSLAAFIEEKKYYAKCAIFGIIKRCAFVSVYKCGMHMFDIYVQFLVEILL